MLTVIVAEPVVSQCPRCGNVRRRDAETLDLCPACLIGSALALDEERCPYQVVAPIAEGRQGVTYLAQPLTGAQGYVALKVLRQRADAEAVLSRYRHWCPALASVEHPSVGKLLDVGLTADGLVYVATEFVAGWSLAAAGSRTSFGQAERQAVSRQLRGAIDAAHQAGVVHLALDAARVKISTVHGPHATILGLGSALIVDGAAGEPAVDRRALAGIIGALEIEP